MSDREGDNDESGSESGYDGDERRRRHEENSDSYESDSSEDGRHEDQEDSANEIDDLDNVDISKMTLCASHKPGSMTRDCQSCSSALAFIDKGIVPRLLASNAGSDLLARYANRCDQVKPTLNLSDSVLALGKQTFTKGQFRDKKIYAKMVKKFLTLPPSQNKDLTIDLLAEDLFQKYRKVKKFSNIFKFQSDMQSCHKNLRLSQRVIFSMIDNTNDELASLRELGEKVGLEFPDDPPLRTGTSVPRDTRQLSDNLHIQSDKGIFPIPSLDAFFQLMLDEGKEVSKENKEMLNNIFKEYRIKCGGNFIYLFKKFSTFLNNMDDKQIFYVDMYSHADAGVRELQRERMATLFKTNIRDDILSESSSKKKEEENKKDPEGLFGGDFYLSYLVCCYHCYSENSYFQETRILRPLSAAPQRVTMS